MTDTVDLYRRLLEAWNAKDAVSMAACFGSQALMVGFDGSLVEGADAIRAHLTPIFADHPTAQFVSIVRGERGFGNAIVLHADAGMVPPGKHHINPRTNTRHVIVARSDGLGLRIETFQNTPIALDQDAKARDAITAELQAVFDSGALLKA